MNIPVLDYPPTSPNKNMADAEFNAHIKAYLDWKEINVEQERTMIAWQAAQSNANLTYVNRSETAASSAEGSASASSNALALTIAASAATLWVSGEPISVADIAFISPNDNLTYFSKGARSSAQNVIDPSEDPANFRLYRSDKLQAVDKDYSGNAVQVFFWDLKSDPDRGKAMRNARGSWFQANGPFPERGFGILKANELRLYDDTTPEQAEWMVIGRSANSVLWLYADLTSVSFLGGMLVIGQAGTVGVSVFDFVADECYSRRADDRKYYPVPIAQHLDRTGAPVVENFYSGGLMDNAVNSVDLCILSGDVVDAKRGYPRPVVAIGTDAGTTILHRENAYHSATTHNINNVCFDKWGALWYTRSVANHYLHFAESEDYLSGDGFGDIVGTGLDASVDIPLLAKPQSMACGDGFVAFAGQSGTDGFSVAGIAIHKPNYQDLSQGQTALVTAEFNTGWLPGGTKACLLCSTEITPLSSGNVLDRSANSNDLPVSGTITRTQVASGAELVWCQLDTDCSVALDEDISVTGMVVWWESETGVPKLYAKSLSGGTSFVNGVAGTPPNDSVEFSVATMTVKSGKQMALMRPLNREIGEEELRFMYETELRFFSRDAKLTIEGANSSVAAICFDPVTGKLHSGGPSNQSVFDGLLRIANTSRTINSSIAAYRGAVLEE